MDRGYLKRHFDRVAAKRLSGVEVNPDQSNQHELNGVADLKQMLGPERRTRQPTTFLYLDDEEESIEESDAWVTWYDARENHATRTEYRLYFPQNAAMSRAQEGDLLVVCMGENGELTIIIVAAESTVEGQVRWLFDLDEPSLSLQVNLEPTTPGDNLVFVANLILEQLGLATELSLADDRLLDVLLERFPDGFPGTKIFSAFARENCGRRTNDGDPDDLLLAWMNQEQKLFETLERHIVSERLQQGFGGDQADVDGFLSFSLSVQNRRKSRAGHAFENHLEELFDSHGIRYTRGGRTERRSKPDFLFPGVDEYHNHDFDSDRITMLGVKTSCKDRWRQVLAEAERISRKHLATLEPSISSHQLEEMAAQNLTLVIPRGLHSTFAANDQPNLLTLSDFIALLEARQALG